MTMPARRIFQTDTDFAHYEVLDMVYEGRAARVLYSGQRQAAQSGIATDENPDLLFDYNQRLLELVTFLKPRRLLLIGGGVYTLPSAVLKLRAKAKIDVVEIDPGLDQIARDYFGWQPTRRVTVYHEDGRQFLERSNDQYDLVILDAYANFSIPALLTEADTADLIRQHLTPSGVAACNIIAAYYGQRSIVLHRLADTYQQYFQTTAIHPASHGVSLWIPQNFLLISQATGRASFDHALRYPEMTVAPQPFDVSKDLET